MTAGAKRGPGASHDLETALGHEFRTPALLTQALCHPSVARPTILSNQRLEFLGDRVLGLVVATMLLEQFPREEEGDLAQRFAVLVKRAALARVARSLDLGQYVSLGRGEADGGGRDKPANLADACEAVIAALYLDGGLAAAERFVRRLWAPLIAEDERPPRDPKTRLQEWAQELHGVLPGYRTLSKAGPAHDPTFTVEVRIGALAPEQGEGGSKRAAEQIAAAKLMARVADGDG